MASDPSGGKGKPMTFSIGARVEFGWWDGFHMGTVVSIGPKKIGVRLDNGHVVKWPQRELRVLQVLHG